MGAVQWRLGCQERARRCYLDDTECGSITGRAIRPRPACFKSEHECDAKSFWCASFAFWRTHYAIRWRASTSFALRGCSGTRSAATRTSRFYGRKIGTTVLPLMVDLALAVTLKHAYIRRGVFLRASWKTDNRCTRVGQ